MLFTSNNHVLGFMDNQFGDWDTIYVLDINTKKSIPILKREFGGFKKINEKENAKMIDDFLRGYEKN